MTSLLIDEYEGAGGRIALTAGIAVIDGEEARIEG